VQLVEPGDKATKPVGQMIHCETDMSALPLAAVPAGHGIGRVLFRLQKYPAGHGSHRVSPGNVPSAQLSDTTTVKGFAPSSTPHIEVSGLIIATLSMLITAPPAS